MSTSSPKSLWKSIDPAFRHLIIGVVALAVLSLLGGLFYRAQSDELAAVPEQKRAVTLETVSVLAHEQGILSISGNVISRDEATLFPEAQGRYTRVLVGLSDSVTAGQVIAEIDNARERAVVQQATGAYWSQLAQLEKIEGSARSEQLSILELSAISAKSSLESTKSATVGALLSAYGTIDDAVNKKTEANFLQASSDTPQFAILTSGSKSASEAQNLRRELLSIIAANAASARTLEESSSFISLIADAESDLRTTRTYLDVLIDALGRGVESSSVSAGVIATNKAEAAAARSAIIGALSTLASAKEQLAQRETAKSIADKNLEQGKTGGQSEDVRSARGGVEAAAGALAIAQAALDKTIIRAPFRGTVNSLSAEVGTFANPQVGAATIANNEALEVVGAITEFDRQDWSVGSYVRINGQYDGIITRIAPALDPITKKIEVRVGLLEESPTITNGQVVRIEYLPTPPTTEDALSLPIEALKITPDGTYVLGVSKEGLVEQYEVTLGGILGERIQITSPLALDLRIVTDARGLSEGMSVTIDSK